jgi:hypothetical protein
VICPWPCYSGATYHVYFPIFASSLRKFTYPDALIATFVTSNSFMPLLYLFIQIEHLPTILPAQSVVEILIQ